VISFSGCFAPLLTSNPPQQHKDYNDYQDDADDADTTVSIAVTVAAKAAAKPAQQKYDEDDYKNESYRHNLSSFRICSCRPESVADRAVRPWASKIHFDHKDYQGLIAVRTVQNCSLLIMTADRSTTKSVQRRGTVLRPN
jgi:hypothetical protein